MPEENTPVDLDTLSDEEINNLPFPSDDLSEEVSDEEPAPESAGADEEELGDEEDLQDDLENDVDNSDPDYNQPPADDDAEPNNEPQDEPDEPQGDKVNSESDSLAELLKTPLKVGETEITINSAEELVTLAKRGLGANKRMQELAPKLKLLSTLEANELLGTDKLNFLIALDKKDPAAIKKLVAESGVDAFDAATDTDEEYVQKDYSVTDKEFKVQQAFDQISTTATYQDTLKTISGYDDDSKVEIRENPKYITQLNEHHENGYYKQIEAIVAKERLMGNLDGMCDFAAYKHVWDTVQEHSARTGGTPEAGHKNGTGDRNGGEQLAGKSGGSEAGNNTNSGKRVGATTAAKKAAESTNKNRGSKKPDGIINFDELTDEEIANLDPSDLF